MKSYYHSIETENQEVLSAFVAALGNVEYYTKLLRNDVAADAAGSWMEDWNSAVAQVACIGAQVSALRQFEARLRNGYYEDRK